MLITDAEFKRRVERAIAALKSMRRPESMRQ